MWFSLQFLLSDQLLFSAADFYFRCNGLYGQVRFDSKDDQKANSKYREAIKGVLPENLSVVDVRCCLFDSYFGLVFSSLVIETDYFWKCAHIPIGRQISSYLVDYYNSSKWENAQVIRNFFEDPTADILYDESQNNGLEKFFSANAKWIWARANSSAPANDNGFCVSCKGHTKSYVPRGIYFFSMYVVIYFDLFAIWMIIWWWLNFTFVICQYY